MIEKKNDQKKRIRLSNHNNKARILPDHFLVIPLQNDLF